MTWRVCESFAPEKRGAGAHYGIPIVLLASCGDGCDCCRWCELACTVQIKRQTLTYAKCVGE